MLNTTIVVLLVWSELQRIDLFLKSPLSIFLLSERSQIGSPIKYVRSEARMGGPAKSPLARMGWGGGSAASVCTP